MQQPFAVGAFMNDVQLVRCYHNCWKKTIQRSFSGYYDHPILYLPRKDELFHGRRNVTNPCLLITNYRRCSSLTWILGFQPTLLNNTGKVSSDFSSTGCFSKDLFIRRCYSEKKPVDSKIEADVEDDEKNLSLFKKFKLMYKRYWYVLIPVHCVTSVFWFGAFFFAAKSGVDIVPILENLGVTEKLLCHLRDSNAGYYAMAYGMYKVATPARYTVTVGGTTISISYLKTRGYIKPVPTKDELKVMYNDKKDEIKEKTEEIKEKYQERREDIRERYGEKREEIKERYQERKDELIEKYRDKAEGFREKYLDKKDESNGDGNSGKKFERNKSDYDKKSLNNSRKE